MKTYQLNWTNEKSEVLTFQELDQLDLHLTLAEKIGVANLKQGETLKPRTQSIFQIKAL